MLGHQKKGVLQQVYGQLGRVNDPSEIFECRNQIETSGGTCLHGRVCVHIIFVNDESDTQL